MWAVLYKAIGICAVILCAFCLKKFHAVEAYGSTFLSKIITRVTLPAALIVGLQKVEFQFVLLAALALGFFTNEIMVLVGYFFAKHKVPQVRTFYMINCGGYNINTICIPFILSFFGANHLAAACMFDIGNRMMSYGITDNVAKNVVGEEDKSFSVIQTIKSIFGSLPFDVYIIMMVLAALHITLPEGFYTVAETFAGANTFLCFFMLGLMMEFKMEKEAVVKVWQVLVLRFAGAILFALIIYFLLPLPQEMKQVLTIVVFAPIFHAAPSFCDKCGADKYVAGVLNSICTPISLLIMTLLTVVFITL